MFLLGIMHKFFFIFSQDGFRHMIRMILDWFYPNDPPNARGRRHCAPSFYRGFSSRHDETQNRMFSDYIYRTRGLSFPFFLYIYFSFLFVVDLFRSSSFRTSIIIHASLAALPSGGLSRVIASVDVVVIDLGWHPGGVLFSRGVFARSRRRRRQISRCRPAFGVFFLFFFSGTVSTSSWKSAEIARENHVVLLLLFTSPSPGCYQCGG